MSSTMHESTPEISSLLSLKSFLFNRNLKKKTGYISQIPQICKDQLCAVGIVEDGRGADLGPMVVGLVYCPLLKTDALEKFRADDLTDLTREDQEVMFLELFRNSDKMGYAFDIIPSDLMPDFNNKRAKKIVKEIGKTACIDLIQKAINEGVNIVALYVNTIAPPKRYENYLSRIFPDIFITVQNDDSAHLVLAAARICSIVTKNHVLEVIKSQKRSFNSASEYQKHRAAIKMLENNPSTSSSSTSSQSQGKDSVEEEEHKNSAQSPPKKKIKFSSEED